MPCCLAFPPPVVHTAQSTFDSAFSSIGPAYPFANLWSLVTILLCTLIVYGVRSPVWSIRILSSDTGISLPQVEASLEQEKRGERKASSYLCTGIAHDTDLELTWRFAQSLFFDLLESAFSNSDRRLTTNRAGQPELALVRISEGRQRYRHTVTIANPLSTPYPDPRLAHCGLRLASTSPCPYLGLPYLAQGISRD